MENDYDFNVFAMSELNEMKMANILNKRRNSIRLKHNSTITLKIKN